MKEKRHTEPKLLFRKKKKNIIREVYLYDRMVVKRFVKLAALPDVRRVWVMEHRALERLEGVPTPKTYGFVEKKINKTKEIIYAREFVDGAPIEKIQPEDIRPLSWIMARIHRRGVITRDPHLENFIRTENGKIIFFDFGRALVLNRKNPLLALLIGKELARILVHAGLTDSGLKNHFLEQYFEFFQPSPTAQILMTRICFLWYRRIQKIKNKIK
jgi:tRNA A-37 threonylcarbamoyl transferase component Bud32